MWDDNIRCHLSGLDGTIYIYVLYIYIYYIYNWILQILKNEAKAFLVLQKISYSLTLHMKVSTVE